MLVFVEVVRAGSFTAAARTLGMPKSSVSRKVSSLEDRLKTQLLYRTTRSIRLTDIGELFHRRCQIAVAEAKAAEELVAERQATPCGRLRITAPPTFSFLGSILAEYLSRYPEVRVELVCTERLVDLVAEGFDVAVRAGRLADSTLIARHLGNVSRVLVATAGYLERRGAPRLPEELREHDTILFEGGREGDLWTLRSKRKLVDVRPHPRLKADDYDLLLEAVLEGLGIALMPSYVCGAAIESGALVRVLPAWSSEDIPIQAIYPANRLRTAKLEALLDLLRERFTGRSPIGGSVRSRARS